MRYVILALVLGSTLLLPGDSLSFTRGHAAPAPRPAVRPAPVHTPAIVAPVRPPVVVRPAPVVRPNPVVVRPNPVVVHPTTPIYRPAVIPKTPVVVRPPTVVRPPVVTRPVIGNRPVVVNRNLMVNRNIYINRPNGYYRPGYAYYHNYYDGWHHGYWGGWYSRPWLWFGAGLATGWLLDSGPAVVYANPYWVTPQVAPVFNYGQPIPVPATVPLDPTPTSDPYALSPPNDVPAAQADDPSVAGAASMLDDARQAFLANDYNSALQLVDQAISKSPKDTTLHEFRALVLFAQQRYQDAAATIYAVLAVGPGWDWDTLSSNYRDPQTYTNQLRALEAYVRANPNNASAKFLLAYEYLVTDNRDAATSQLRSVVALQPNDQLAAYLLQMLTNPASTSDRPTPGM